MDYISVIIAIDNNNTDCVYVDDEVVGVEASEKAKMQIRYITFVISFKVTISMR